jgi:hypothetical protein
MSDTAAPVAPSTPTPPTQNEVPINPNPPALPTPVGAQAPQAPDKPPSRRDAIQAAFDRATKQQDGKEPPKAKAAPKAAEAKPGHNQPPEPVDAEKPSLDLKKRPDDQPRDRGRFAPRQATETNESTAADAAKGVNGTREKSSANTLPENSPFRDPPPRMAEHGKREWAATPESVRGEVHRMHQEFGNAYQQLRGAAEAFQPIARFHQMAQQHGTTLERALHNYTSIETKLRSDVIGGLDVIINNLGMVDPNTNQRIGLRDIAYHVLSQSPEQLKQIQMGNQQSATGQQIGSLHQEIAGLKNALHQMHTAQQFSYTRSQVDQFAASHPRFDELGTLIEKELQLGFDLESAYRRAELLAPATHAAQTGSTPPAAQTRAADRSISGSPGVTGSNPASRRSEKPTGRREAIANAIKRVNGGL